MIAQPLENLNLPARHIRALTRRQRRQRQRILLACFAVLLMTVGLFALMLLSETQILPEEIAWPTPKSSRTIDDVPYISQIGEFPTGCESVSATMVLQYYGFAVTPGAFIDGFLPLGDAPQEDSFGQWTGCDPWEAFPGDPRSEDGWGCYAPVMETALNAYLEGSGYEAEYLAGLSLDTLCETYIDNDTPVLLWATIDMDEPYAGLTWTVPESGREITWIGPLHCLVLTGYDADGYRFNDPLAGADVWYDKDAVETAYTALSEQAVVVQSIQ